MAKINKYLLVLILIFVPLYPKFPLLGVSGTFVAVRLEDFIVAIVVIWWLLYRLKIRDFSLLPLHRSIILYLLIGLMALFSGIFLTKTAGPSLGLLHAARRFEYMLMFLVFYDLFPKKSSISFITRIIIFVSLIVALFGLGQQYLGFPVISTTNSEFAKGLALTLGPGARINSTFAGHYDLAAYTVLPLLILLALIAADFKPKPILLLFFSVIYYTMLLSASRITFASFYLSAALLVWLVNKKTWLVPLSLLACISILISPQLRGRYLDFFTRQLHLSAVTAVQAQEPKNVDAIPDALKPAAVPEDRSFNIRLQVEWPRAVRAFIKNPVFGTGFSSVGLAVDNDYLRSLAETGLLGFLAFMFIFIRFFKHTAARVLHPRPDINSVFILSVCLSLVSLLINAVFIDVFEASKIAIITWSILGITTKVAADL